MAKFKYRTAAFLFSLSLLCTGCDSTESTLGGAAVGTGLGAGMGYAVGGKGGAALGGVLGGLAGGAIGHQAADQDEKDTNYERNRYYQNRKNNRSRWTHSQNNYSNRRDADFDEECRRLELERQDLALERERVQVDKMKAGNGFPASKDSDLERERLKLEQERLQLEKQKLEFEQQKARMER